MNSMRFFLFLFLIGFQSIIVMCQQSPWNLQRASGLSNSADAQIRFSPVDDNICWGISTINPQFIRTLDGGANWTVAYIPGLTNGLNSITALDANNAWICKTDAVYKTIDGGSTWNKQTTAFQGFSSHPKIIHFFDYNNGICVGDPNDGNWAIYSTTDGGTNWTRVPSGNIPPPMPASETGIPGSGEASGNSFWFSTFWGSLYRSTDRGMTWAVSRNIVGDNDGYGFAFKDSLNGLACSHVSADKISFTLDGGSTWTPVAFTGLTEVSPFFIEHVKGTESSYVITSHNNFGGIFQAIPGSAYSSDNGKTWTKLDNLPHGPTSFSNEERGWSGGMNDSIYTISKEITGVKELLTGSPINFNLKQNYPNPFNPSTTIIYSIASPEFVTLKIYDVLGREAAVLVNEEKPAGIYEMEFNASKLSSGIYFYKLQTSSFVETKKMNFLK